MIIIFFDNTLLKCDSIEFSTDGKNIIVDGCRVIPLITILRIITD